MRHRNLLASRWRILSEPFEAFLSLAALTAGVAATSGLSRPAVLTVIGAHPSRWVFVAWGLALTLSGLLILAGRALVSYDTRAERIDLGFGLEGLGLTAFCGTALVYTVGAFSFGARGVVTGAYVGSLGLSCAARALLVEREWRGYHKAIKKADP